jgi:excisionase family DNA binding protein
MEKRFLTVPEAAAFLSVSQSTIRLWISKDQPRSLREGGRVRIDREYLKGRKKAAEKRQVGRALWTGDLSSLSPGAALQFDKLVAESRSNPALGFNKIDRLRRLRNPEHIAHRQDALSEQPRTVKDEQELDRLLHWLELRQVAQIDSYLDRRAVECKTYWMRLFGIARGRRPLLENTIKYGEWARLQAKGMTLKEIAARCLPGYRKAEDNIRKGIEAYLRAVARLRGVPYRN